MATREKKRIFADDDSITDAQLLPRIGADVADDEYNPEMEAAFEQLREDFRTANSEGTLWVHRVPLDANSGDVISNGKNVFLFSAPIQRYSTEEIYAKVQREFMPADMRVTCIRVSATKKGERGVRFNHMVMVEQPKPREEKAASDGGAMPLGGVSDVVRAIQEGQQAMLAMMQRALPQPTPQPAQGMQPQIDTLRALAEVMFLLNGGGGTRAPAAAPSVLEQLKTLRELRGFVGELGGDEAPTSSDGPLAVLKHLSPWASVFGQLLNQQQQTRRMLPSHVAVQPPPRAAVQAQPPQAAAPGIAPMTPVAVEPVQRPTSSTEQDATTVLFQSFGSHMEALTRAAESGEQPENVAPMVLQMIPEGSQQEAAFIAFLEDAHWWRNVCAIHPAARAHEAWFARLRTAILAEFDDGNATTDTQAVT